MKLAIYGRRLEPVHKDCLLELIQVAADKAITLTFYRKYWESVCLQIPAAKEIEVFDSHENLLNCNFVLSFGGDGTLLDVVTLIKDSSIPVLGVNTGRLGFLTSGTRGEVTKILQALLNKSYKIDSRSLLSLNSSGIFKDANFALNEFALHKKDVSSLIVVHTFINNQFLNSYWADGLIVATPTGSTAYSLSCGGPIVFPNSNNFVINPVAPHNLTQRPIVVSDDCVISLRVEGRSDKFLCTMDSRIETVSGSMNFELKRAGFNLNIVRLLEDDFMETLRNKMMWGLDKRN